MEVFAPGCIPAIATQMGLSIFTRSLQSLREAYTTILP